MALENYRITEFQEKTQVDNGDYVLIDSATDGTHKYQLSRIPAQASAEVAAAVAAEETAREAADAAEVTARNAAISAAISDEVTARNAAIAANVDNTLTMSGKAADAKKTGDEIADLKSDLTNIYNNLFDFIELSTSDTSARGIADSGGIVYDADKTLHRYAVTAGDLVYLYLASNSGASTATYVFKSGYDMSTSKVGDVHFGAVDGIVKVPVGATYIAVSQSTNSTTFVVKLVKPFDYQSEIDDIKKGAYEQIKGTFELGSILNGNNSTTTTRIRHKAYVSYNRDVTIFFANGYKGYVALYKADGTYDQTTAPKTNDLPLTIPANTKFRLVYYKSTEETVTDIDAYINTIYVTTQLFNNPQIYRNNLIRQVAHQGYNPNPANSVGYSLLSSFKASALIGFTHGETDIQFSSDGIPLCCHDATFTDLDTSTTITIADHTYEELQTYNYHGGKIASFDDFVKICKMYGMGIYVDHLDGSWTSDKWNSLFAVIQKYNMAKNTFWLLAAVSPVLTDPITTWYQDANFVRVFTTAPSDFPTYVASVEALKTDANIVSIDLPASAVSANDMPTYAAQIPPGVELEIWTVDTVSDWYDYLPYVSAITSNKICANIARQLT